MRLLESGSPAQKRDITPWGAFGQGRAMAHCFAWTHLSEAATAEMERLKGMAVEHAARGSSARASDALIKLWGAKLRTEPRDLSFFSG